MNIIEHIDASIDAFKGRAESMRRSATEHDRPQDDASAAVYECEISTLKALRDTAEPMIEELAELRAIATLAGRVHLSAIPKEVADPLRAALVRWRRLSVPGAMSAVDPQDCLFFGVWPGHGAGHFLRRPGGKDLYDNALPGLGKLPLDGHWQPFASTKGRYNSYPDRQDQGPCRLSHAYGWTFVGWWDRTEDRRGGCNSTLLIPAQVDFDEALRLGRLAFPTVFERLAKAGITLTLAEVDGGS